MKPKVLIVGLGKIGMMYDFSKKINFSNHADSFFNNKNFKLVGGVDTKHKKRKLFAKKYKLPSYSDFVNAYKKLKPNILTISVPTDKFDNIFNLIISNNLRPKLILLEKPGSYNFINLKFFNNYCKKKKIQLFINYQRIYSENLNKIKANITPKVIGKILSINIFYHKGFYNSCSHYINFLFKILNKNKFNNLKIINFKKKNDDYLINFNVYLKYILKFRTNKKNFDEKIVINGSKAKFFYFTEKSKVYVLKNRKKINIDNDFDKLQLNVLKKIIYLYGTNVNFNINNNLKTLKFLNFVTRKLQKS